MRTRTKLLALITVAAAGAYAARKIQKTHAKPAEITAPLPEIKPALPKAPAKTGLSKSVLASYKTQIAEMTKTLDPKDEIQLVHYFATDPVEGNEAEVLMMAAGYQKIVGTARTMYKKAVKADAQTILDAVIFAAETAKSHKLTYLGWDFAQ